MIHSSTLGTLVLALLFAEVTAEQSLYAQCGGINWTGGTVCWPGSTCTKHNDWYYQCLPGTTTPTSTSRPIATTTTTALIVTTSSGRSIPTGNPFVGKEIYANEGYKEKVKAEYNALVSKRNTDLAAKVAKLINVPVAIWAVDRASVASIGLYLRDASEVQTRTGKKQIVPLVVYNLPDRDCAGGASAGEFYSASSGEVKYREFIAAVKSQIQANANVAVAMILEPDSVGNIVTNQAIPFCATAAQVHRRGLAYAISVLGALPNVYLYLDGAHATWLGWPDDLGRTASVLGSIYTAAKQLNPKAVVRGISTDVSNYNGLEAEKTYHSDLKPYLDKVGYPAHFVVDQSRSGNQNKTRSGEGWCNYKYAGIGERPTAMNSTLLDAILWVKPPGESDGTSDPNSTRYNPVCASNTSYVPSPEAGQWGSGVFRSMVQYANPPL